MKELNKQIILDYLKNNKELITPKEASKSYNLTSDNEENNVVFLAVGEEGYLSQEEYEQKRHDFLENFKGISKYSKNVVIKQNAPYFLLRLQVEERFLIISKVIIHEANCLGFDEDVSWVANFRLDIEHILFYDSLDLTFRKNGHTAPVRLGFGGIGGLGLQESLFKGFPLFYQVDDFERDKAQELATTLTYGDLLRAQRDGLNKKELIQKHLKKAVDLDGVINFNKFTPTEAYMLVKIMTEMDEKTFANFAKWYRESGRFYKLEIRHDFKSQRKELITFFIMHSVGQLPLEPTEKCSSQQRENYYIAKDYYTMCKSRRRKLKIDFTSPHALRERHDKIYASIENKELKRDDYQKEFDIRTEYKPLVEALRKRGSGYKYLSKPAKLIQEGNRMGHCVGSYTYSVRQGWCIIATTDISGIHYTLEIAAVIKDHKLEGYSLEQMQSRFNGGIKHPSHEATVIDFLNNIRIPSETRKKRF